LILLDNLTIRCENGRDVFQRVLQFWFLGIPPPMPRKPEPKLLPTWQKYVARVKAARLGAVEAPDAVKGRTRSIVPYACL
jgi:hypothetical protein